MPARARARAQSPISEIFLRVFKVSLCFHPTFIHIQLAVFTDPFVEHHAIDFPDQYFLTQPVTELKGNVLLKEPYKKNEQFGGG